MPKFRATVQFTNLDGEDTVAVRQALDDEVKRAGFAHWRIVSIEPEVKAARWRLRSTPDDCVSRPRRPLNAGGVLLVTASAWAIWFFWMLSGC